MLNRSTLKAIRVHSDSVTADPVALSARFLRRLRAQESTAELASTLATIDEQDLRRTLDTNDARLAFWINLYNVAAQRALSSDTVAYDNRRSFFTEPVITVAGTELSLDTIEHGILRRSYSKYTLGYVRKPGPFRHDFVDTHRVAQRDPRIHFALNCGARSCPPVAAYTRAEVDRQLDVATQTYLEATIEYQPEVTWAYIPNRLRAGRVRLPLVMLWFRGDFGGRAGILEFLYSYEQLPPNASPRFSYHPWDWTRKPGNFADESHPLRALTPNQKQ